MFSKRGKRHSILVGLVGGLLAACGGGSGGISGSAAGGGGFVAAGSPAGSGSGGSSSGSGSGGASSGSGSGGSAAGGAGGGSVAGGGGGPEDSAVIAGTPVALALSKGDQSALAGFSEVLAAARPLSAAELLAKHPVKYSSNLGYDPSTAHGLELIQRSTLALDADEQAHLQQNGFVVSAGKGFLTVLSAYESIYVQDLPLYVSADSILDAVHRSYDDMLKQVESSRLIAELGSLLSGMRSRLSASTGDAVARRDADFFLSVALGLLQGGSPQPVAGADTATVASFLAAAMSGTGRNTQELFGVPRDIDWSQFTPRGHYIDSPELSCYFRAMIWLGRIDLRLIETQPDGSTQFHRRQLEAMLLLRDLVDQAGLGHWRTVDATLEAFIGESDYMRLPQVDALLKDLGVTDAAQLAAHADQEIAQTIIDHGYGAQRIASQLIVNMTLDGHTLPLDRSFALFGQRFAVDSYVFSNVVYDRVKGRLMPSPLDVGFAALGNDTAAQLLSSELTTYEYAPQLDALRVLIDAHGTEFWAENLYNGWLAALRTLSVRDDSHRPTVTASEAWNRRLLSTQLASWAQLRHDTVLYVKQSTTVGPGCDYPDAYIEPYPAFFETLTAFAARGRALADVLSGGTSEPASDAIRGYFEHFGSSMSKLGAMAKAQQAGTPFDAEQLAFINGAVHSRALGCTGAKAYDGWFAQLHFGAGADGFVAIDRDPTIADVHTQPADAAGHDVGRVLHVGTGDPRLMVVTVDSCEGPRAYAGVAMAYHEVITDGWYRLNDLEWEKRLNQATPPPDVEWASYVSPRH